jgi:hypothetical protein
MRSLQESERWRRNRRFTVDRRKRLKFAVSELNRLERQVSDFGD